MSNKAVVVLSGGQDSITCLMQALHQEKDVHCIVFEYGQKHLVEVKQAARVCHMLDIPCEIHKIPSLEVLADSALVGEDGDVTEAHHANASLPASFVPNRNALFLTIAHAYAQKIGAQEVITGVCQTDYSGYPDCRDIFIKNLQHALTIGYQVHIDFVTPLMHLTKAETFKLAEDVGGLEMVLEYSHTCYNGDHETRHDWGYGCGECPACELRAKGYAEYIGE